MRILLHDCCAPCGAFVVNELLNAGHAVTVYFYNPNIFPAAEYARRLNEMRRFCQKKNILLIIGKYAHDEWHEAVRGLEDEPEGGKRCERCFLHRLSEVAQKAMEEKYDGFATTLTISPHKPALIINKIGRELAEFYSLKFIDTIWRKNNGFKKACALAQAENFHRQNYCGCAHSTRSARSG